MGDQKPTNQSQKKQKARGRGKVFRDAMPLQASRDEESPFNKGLFSLLNVQKAPFLQKQRSHAGSSSKSSVGGSLAVSETSSSESFSSAKSQILGSQEHSVQSQSLPLPSMHEGEHDEMPSPRLRTDKTLDIDETGKYQTAEGSSSKLVQSEQFDTDVLIPDPDVTDETLPSYDEEVVDIDTRVPSFLQRAFSDCDISTKMSEDILKSAFDEETDDLPLLKESQIVVDEETSNLPLLIESESVTELMASAALSQAYLEALTEDGDIQIQSLLRMRDEEMQVNESLRSRMIELETLKDTMDHLVSDMEASYSETYSELVGAHQNELELIRLESLRQNIEMECQIKELNGKLLLAEGVIAAKEQLEIDLNSRVNQLEESLREKEKHCREELESVVAKSIQCEMIALAKNDIEEEMTAEYRDVCLGTDQKSSAIDDVLAQSLVPEILQRAEMDISSETASRHRLHEEEFDRASMVADLRRASVMGDDDVDEESASNYRLHEEEFDRASMVADLRRASVMDGIEVLERKSGCDSIKCENQSNGSAKSRKRHMSSSDKRDNVKRANSTISVLKSQLEANIGELAVAKKEIENLKRANSTISVLKSQLEANIGELTSARREIEDLKEAKREVEKKNDDCCKRLTEVTQDRDQLLIAKSTCEAEKKLAEVDKAELEGRIDELNEKLTQVAFEKKSILLKRISLDATIEELRKERDQLMSKNRELEIKASSGFLEREKRLSLEAELEKLKMEFERGSSRNQSLESDLYTIRKELDELRSDWSLAKSRTDRLDTSMPQMNWSRCTDATQYMDVMPPPLPVDVSCQMTFDQAEAECQTSMAISETAAKTNRNSKSPLPFSKPGNERHESIEKELETSWTERCEVEQRLAAVLAENTLLRQRILQLEAAGRRASGMVDAGVPSVAVWLQLRSCVKEIVAELAVLRGMQGEWEDGGGVSVGVNNALLNQHYENRSFVGGRSSPEGGRESPRLTDGGVESSDDIGLRSANELEERSGVHELQNIVQQNNDALDPNSSALLEMVQELLQCLGGDSEQCDVSCSFNSALNASLSERLSDLPGATELCRRLQEVKEEVTRLFILSQRGDPVIAKLQEEVRSLEHQVVASDKQVRSMRAFLEEQAGERELERDEAAGRIEELAEMLRTRDRQLAKTQLLQQDFDLLEQQFTEAQSVLRSETERRSVAESQLEQTFQKIGTLRDVLETLEAQLAEKSEQLQTVLSEKTRLQEQLVQDGQLSLERENAQRDSYSDTLAYVARLEEEVTSLRHHLQTSGPESLASARMALRELETAVARRTRDLELVQVAWSGGHSSASEELSTRDHPDATRCATPDEMMLEAGAGLCEDVERLRERLLKHARVEESALKKIKELEQVAAKVENLQVDMGVAMKQVDQLLNENETLKTRMEGERLRALDTEALALLEKKNRHLQKQLEEMEETLSAEKKILLEKLRREERLQETLEAREMELRQEAKAAKEAQNQIQTERSLRLASEAHLRELAYLLQEKRNDDSRQLTPKKIVDDGPFVSNKNSSVASTKRVKFSTPESFVGGSLTPISPAGSSILRNAGSCREDWLALDQLSRKPLLHESISSMAALQLSPRAPFTSSLLEDSVPQKNSSSVQTSIVARDVKVETDDISDLMQIREEQKLREEVTYLTKKVEETSHLLTSLEAKYNQKICDLKEEFADREVEFTRNCKELEKALKLAEEKVLKAHEQLRKQDEAVLILEGRCKETLDALEDQKVQGLRLVAATRTQLDNAVSQLEKQQKETCLLRESLSQASDELNVVKSERQLKEQQLSSETLLLKLQLSTTREELDSIKNEKAHLIDNVAQLSCKMEELEVMRDKTEAQLTNLIKECDEKIISVSFKLKNEKDKVENLTRQIEERDRCHAQAEAQNRNEMDSLKAELIAQTAEQNKVKSENEKLCSLLSVAEAQLENVMARLPHSTRVGPAGDGAASPSSMENVRKISHLEKFCTDAATRVADLRMNLESSLLKCSSLEAELVIVRRCLECSQSKVTNLEAQLSEAVARAEKLSSELALLDQKDKITEVLQRQPNLASSQETCSGAGMLSSESPFIQNSKRPVPVEILLELAKRREDHLATQLERVETDLARSRGKEVSLRKALTTAVELGKQAAMRENDLKNELVAAEREVLRLSYLTDAQGAKVRGLERLHRHGVALQMLQREVAIVDPREVRSAGDGEIRPAIRDWTVNRLESYRKALVWQKKFLQGSGIPRDRMAPIQRPRLSLRIVGLMVVALFRMRFIVRRWKSRLPPLVSPPRGRECPLMLTSPPCKDRGFSLNQIT